MIKNPLLPGQIENTQDNLPESNPAPNPKSGAGIAGKLDEKDNDEFEGGTNIDNTLDLANFDTNKTSQNLIQKSSDKNQKDDDNMT